MTQPFLIRYGGQPQTLQGEHAPCWVKGVALVRASGGRPQLLLLLERRQGVGPKAKPQADTKLFQTLNPLEVELVGKGMVLRSDDPQHPLHLQIHAHHVVGDTEQHKIEAMSGFSRIFVEAKRTGHAPVGMPAAEETKASHIGAAPVAKKPRLGGGFKPGSNLGSASGVGKAGTPGGVPGFTSMINLWGAKGNNPRNRQFNAAHGVAPRRPGQYALPPASQPPPPPEAPRKPTPPVSTTLEVRQPELRLSQPAVPRSGGALAAGGGSGGGFKNLGNTCYINGVLSALLGMRSFVADLTSPPLFDRLSPHLPAADSVFRALCGLARDHASGGTATPRLLKQAIAQRCSQFAGYEQQDAHEFLADCLDVLHEETLAAAKADAADEVTPPLPTHHGGGGGGGGGGGEGARAQGGGRAGAAATAPPLAEAALPCALNFECEARRIRRRPPAPPAPRVPDGCPPTEGSAARRLPAVAGSARADLPALRAPLVAHGALARLLADAPRRAGRARRAAADAAGPARRLLRC